jgi:hypothetical protein
MKQFIKTTDKSTADKLITSGFNLVSQVGNLYIFLNQTPKNFDFNVIDKTKIAYDNILSL